MSTSKDFNKQFPLIAALIAMGFTDLRVAHDVRAQLIKELTALDNNTNSGTEEQAADNRFSEFGLYFNNDGINKAKSILNDPYTSKLRRDVATDFLLEAHARGFYK